MKKVIDGKKFDTESAKKCGECKTFLGTESLYQRKTGDFFLHKCYKENGVYPAYEEIEPISYKEAQEWTYESLGVDAYYELFVKPFEENGKKSLFALYISESVIAELKKIAGETGIQTSDFVESIIRKELAENRKKSPKYQIAFEGSENGDWMGVTIKDVLDEDVDLEAEVKASDFPYLLEAIKAGIEKYEVFEDLTEEEAEKITDTYEEYYTSKNISLFSLEDDEEYGYIYAQIDKIYEIVLSECFSFWSYMVLLEDITEKAKKYGVSSDELIPFGDDITADDVEKCKDKFYYDVMKKIYIDQERKSS